MVGFTSRANVFTVVSQPRRFVAQNDKEIKRVWREKTDKEKSHKGIWRSGCPGGVPGTKEFGGRDAPEASQGQTRDVPGTPGTFGPALCVRGQNVPGTDGTYYGTDGTCPRDRRDAHQGVSRQNPLCLLVFFLPRKGLGCLLGVCSEFARNSLGICSEFARNSL